MRKCEYVQKVLGCLPRLTSQERVAVGEELYAHIEDHMEALLDLGYEPELAEQRTMERMGDPEEVGWELDKQYSMVWLVIERTLKALIWVFGLLLVWNILTFYTLWGSLQVRIEPYEYATENRLNEIDTKLDIRMEIGSDILHIYGSGVDESNQAHVLYYWYDQDPLGYVTGEEIKLEDCRGEELLCGGGWSRNSRVSSHHIKTPIRPGDPYVTAVVERYGQRYEARVPLEWEEVQP